MLTQEQILSKIERFIKSANISATDFGRKSIGDGNLVGDLRKGRCPNLRTVSKIAEFMKMRQKAKDGANA